MMQNTKDWLTWRVHGLGSSDGPIITGRSKNKSILELWDEKKNKTIKEEEPNYIQKKGHRLEEYVRSMMEFRTGRSWRPKLFEHSKFPFMRASMDGWNEELHEGWENKYMGKEMFLLFSDTTKSIMDRIPVEYIDQIAHQFFVTEAKAITLSGICDSIEIDEAGRKLNTVSHLRIPLTEELRNYVIDYAKVAFAFWDSIQKNERPDAYQCDSVVIDNLDLQSKVMKYVECHAVIKKYQEDAENAKRLIFSHEARFHPNMTHHDHRVYIVNGEVKVDYEKAFKDFCSWLFQLKTAALNFEIDQFAVWNSITSFPDRPNLEKYTYREKESLHIKIGRLPKKLEIEEAVKVGHILPKKQSDDPFDFVLPTTRRRPKNWAKKSIEDKIDFLKDHIKNFTGVTDFDRKIINDFIDLLKSQLPPEEPVKTAAEIVSEALDQDKLELEAFVKERERLANSPNSES